MPRWKFSAKASFLSRPYPIRSNRRHLYKNLKHNFFFVYDIYYTEGKVKPAKARRKKTVKSIAHIINQKRKANFIANLCFAL